MKPRIIGAVLLCLPYFAGFTQDKAPIKYGKISIEDFKHPIDPADSSATVY